MVSISAYFFAYTFETATMMEIYPYWAVFMVPVIGYIFGCAGLILMLFYVAKIALYDYHEENACERLKFVIYRGAAWFLLYYAMGLFRMEILVTNYILLLIFTGIQWFPQIIKNMVSNAKYCPPSIGFLLGT